MSECAFTQLALAPPTLLKALKQSEHFAAGCPFPGKAGTGAADGALLDVLGSLPEEELNSLITLLRSEGESLRARLDIDDSGWEALLGRIRQPSGSAVLVESTPGADEKDLSQEAVARRRRAEAKREAEATMLSVQLKQGTKDIHAAAENVHFVREFIQGCCSRAVYAAMLKDLYHVYVALEDAAERCARDDGPFAPLHFPYELARVPSLEADLRSLFGPAWRTAPECQPSEAAEAYVARLRTLSEERPELLVAHTYTRYLGDLSGGRVLMRGAPAHNRPESPVPQSRPSQVAHPARASFASTVAKKLLGPSEDERAGVAFFVFENIPEPKRFKQRYRSAMDTLPVDAALTAELVAEANVAFELNIGLFHELDARMAAEGFVAPPLSRDPNTTASAAASGACPFAQYVAEGRPVPEGMVCARLAAQRRSEEDAAERRLLRRVAMRRSALPALMALFCAVAVALAACS